MSQNEAGDSMLRLAFYRAVEEFFAFYADRVGKLQVLHKTPEEKQMEDCWTRLYEVVRDNNSGLEMLKELQYLRDEVERLEIEVARLNSMIPNPPVKIDISYRRGESRSVP